MPRRTATGAELRFLHAIKPAGPPPFNETKVRERLDATMDSALSRYETPEGQARVGSQFRMSTGFGGTPAHNLVSLLRDLPKGAVSIDRIGYVLAGRGSSADIADVTQKLVDAGKLPPASTQSPTLASRVQALQWNYHIGVDCAGYVQRAFLASRGTTDRAPYGLKGILDENLAALSRNPMFKKIEVSEARVGDLFILDPPPNDRVGHTVIVAGHHPATEGDLTQLPEAVRGQARAFLGRGDVQAFEVDSSWGSGDEGLGGGGVQRRVWLHSPSTGEWASASPVDKALSIDRSPYGHPINGVFRPRSEG